jgi:hypothetical protein
MLLSDSSQSSVSGIQEFGEEFIGVSGILSPYEAFV